LHFLNDLIIATIPKMSTDPVKAIAEINAFAMAGKRIQPGSNVIGWWK
jgi:hypothetical protein